jgi:drug/metabolite transporter (DMT)-like permease
MRDETRFPGFVALFVSVFAIAWSAIFVRWTHMPGVASAFYRVLIASIALWLILLLRGIRHLRVSRQVMALASLGGLFFAADIGLYNVAVLRTTAGGATFLGNNAPLIVGLLTWAITKRLPPSRFWAALGMALVGAGLIVSVDWKHHPAASSGDVLAFTASVCFALYLLTTERLRQQSDTAIIVALSTTVSTVALFTFATLFHISLAVPDKSALFALLGLGLICQLAGYLGLTYALGHVPATISSVVLLAVAPFTALLAFILFGEAMASVQLFGGALILVAVWIVSNKPRTEHLEP